MDFIERPPMRFCDGVQLFGRFREGDVHPLLALAGSLQKELESQRRLTHAWITLNEVHPVAGQSAHQDVVEAFNAGPGNTIRAHADRAIAGFVLTASRTRCRALRTKWMSPAVVRGS